MLAIFSLAVTGYADTTSRPRVLRSEPLVLETIIGWIGDLVTSTRDRYAVNPYVFLALSAVCGPLFYYSLYRMARALRNDRGAVGRWSMIFLAATVTPYLYVLIFGRNLPWWVYGVLAAAVGWGVYQLVARLRARGGG